MRQIPLSQGRVAQVDDADYEWLRRYRWCLGGHRTGIVYAMRKVSRGVLYMHRMILGLQPGDKRECDHKNGDGLDNRRFNLRACTTTQNQQNSRRPTIHSSKYKGVCLDRRYRKWQVRIRVNGKRICLGMFDSESDAAYAYDAAAMKHFGEYARTNHTLGLL